MPVLQNQQALALYNEAQQAMTQDDFDTARRKLKEAHQLDPQVTFDIAMHIASLCFHKVLEPQAI